MKITVQHMMQNRETGEVEGYRDVAIVDASRIDSVEEALEYAYRYTNNVLGSWSIKERELGGLPNGDFNDDVTVLYTRPDGMGQRSTMTGDRMIVDGVTYKCAVFGFEKVEFDIDLSDVTPAAISDDLKIDPSKPAYIIQTM